MTAGQAPWVDANQRHLAAALATVRRHLCAAAGRDEPVIGAADEPPSANGAPAPALESLSAAFGLSRFERDVARPQRRRRPRRLLRRAVRRAGR